MPPYNYNPNHFNSRNSFSSGHSGYSSGQRSGFYGNQGRNFHHRSGNQGYYSGGHRFGHHHPSNVVPDIEIVQVNPNLFHAFFKISSQSKATLLNPQSLIEIQKESQTKLRLKRNSASETEPSIIQIEGKRLEQVQNALVSLAYYAKYGFTMYTTRIFIDLGENIEPRFDLPARIRGPNDAYLHHIETKCKHVQVRLKGKNSGNPVGNGKKRDDEDSDLSLHIHLVSSSRKSLHNAQMLAESLVAKVKKDYTNFVHSKMNSSIGSFEWHISKSSSTGSSTVQPKEELVQDGVNRNRLNQSRNLDSDTMDTTVNGDNFDIMEDESLDIVTPSDENNIPSTQTEDSSELADDITTSQLPNQVVKQRRKAEEIDINCIKSANSLLNLRIEIEAKRKLGLIVQELI